MTESECIASGHVWDNADVRRTGSGNDAAQALHNLDPMLTVTGH
jgi:hypothetical protein